MASGWPKKNCEKLKGRVLTTATQALAWLVGNFVLSTCAKVYRDKGRPQSEIIKEQQAQAKKDVNLRYEDVFIRRNGCSYSWMWFLFQVQNNHILALCRSCNAEQETGWSSDQNDRGTESILPHIVLDISSKCIATVWPVQRTHFSEEKGTRRFFGYAW